MQQTAASLIACNIWFSSEGSGAAAEAWSRGKCSRQVLADAAACGCCQPCLSLCRDLAYPAEQPEPGRSHRPNCSAPRCSEWVSGGKITVLFSTVIRIMGGSSTFFLINCFADGEAAAEQRSQPECHR